MELLNDCYESINPKYMDLVTKYKYDFEVPNIPNLEKQDYLVNRVEHFDSPCDYVGELALKIFNKISTMLPDCENKKRLDEICCIYYLNGQYTSEITGRCMITKRGQHDINLDYIQYYLYYKRLSDSKKVEDLGGIEIPIPDNIEDQNKIVELIKPEDEKYWIWQERFLAFKKMMRDLLI